MSKPYAFEQITVSTSVETFTAAKVKSESNGNIYPTEATFTLKDADIRYTVDGTTPTTSLGMLGTQNSTITLDDEKSIRNFQAIRDGSTDVVLDVTYFKG